jgi:xylulokinase
MRYVIGCDVGSQALKVVLWREDGQILGTDTAQYPIVYPQPAWAEQDSSHWWRAMVEVIPRLYQRLGVSPNNIVAIGIDGTVDGFVPVAENGEALTSHFLWMDRRAVEECDGIAALIEPQRLFQVTGLNLDASHTAAKMLWLRNHRPEIYKRSWKLMPSATFAVYMLTGKCVVDYSNASSTMLFDVHTRQWSSELLELMEISAELLPEVRKATDVAGPLTAEAAEALGLPTDTLVVVGCGDEHASCVGAGVIEPGIVADILGTAEPVCIPAHGPVFDGSQLVETHCHAHPERWLLENPGFVSGGNYRWFRDNFYASDKGAAPVSYEVLNQEADTISPGSEGVIFLPSMMGAMAPEWNSKARGVFYGLTLAHTRGHMVRALLEGCVYALRSIIESMQRAGCETREIRAVGGGAQSRLLRQIRADVTGIPVASLSTAETTVVGAALLAAVGAGVCSSLQEAADLTTHVVEVNEPNPANRAVYDQAYGNFLHVYESLKESYEKCLLPT